MNTRKRSHGASSSSEIEDTVNHLLAGDGITSTETKMGWCLKEGLTHVMTVDNGRIVPLIQQHGLPKIYTLPNHCRHEDTKGENEARNCFQSLCRIIAGQQLAGAAAKATWKRLLQTTEQNLTPEAVLNLADSGLEEHLRKPAGLSNAKARSIVALAQAFHDDDLSETFLMSPSSSESDIREALLKIKGIGPWSCDMFLMFYLEQPNLLPVGDLGVRKGMAKFFSLKGKGVKGSLCPKQDLEAMQTAMEPYQPFRSLVTYYMWRVADTKDFYQGVDTNKSKELTVIPTKRAKKNITRQVTP